jgi:uncharacterized protein (TIGR02118 family)
MIKFVVAFRKPQDNATFEDRYQDFLALAERMPALQRRQVVHVLGSPQGQPAYERLLELYFSSMDVLQAALLSPIGQEAGAELAKFPASSADLWYGEVYED